MTNVKLPQQEAYSQKQAKLAELRRFANAAARRAEREWHANNPNYQDLAVRVQNFSYVRNKKGTTRVLVEIAKRMTLVSNQDKTQIQILRDMQSLFPEMELKASLWHKALSGVFLEKIKPAINGNLQKQISFTGCKTLSQIRKRVKASICSSSGKVFNYKPSISFTKEAVIINEVCYPYIMKKSKGISYPCVHVPLESGRRASIRLDGLLATIKKDK